MREEKGRVKARIMEGEAMERALTRIAHEILEREQGVENVVLVGIVRRGALIAERISRHIERIEGICVPVGSLDITRYRDDLSKMRETDGENGDIPSVDGKKVILVDDVICTGRTVRAALEGVFRRGRPSAVRLAVLIDRGLREIPFKPDYVGKNIPTSHAETVSVKVRSMDGGDSVSILSEGEM